jgi:hypothetical protein
MHVARHAAALGGVRNESQKQIHTSINKSLVGCKCHKNRRLTSVMERGGLEAQGYACLAWSSVLPREASANAQEIDRYQQSLYNIT